MEQMKQNDGMEIDLLQVFFWLRQRVWIILLSGVLTGILTFVGTKFFITSEYEATTTIHVINKAQSDNPLSLNDLQIGSQLTNDYMVIIKSRPVLEKVIENLNLPLTYKELSNKITIDNISNTRMIAITASYPDPAVVKQIVDEISTVSSVRIAEVMDTDEPNVVEESYVPLTPSSPSVKKNTVIGVVLGAMLMSAIIIIKNLLDDRIKSTEDIDKYLGINTLCMIPITKSVEGV